MDGVLLHQCREGPRYDQAAQGAPKRRQTWSITNARMSDPQAATGKPSKRAAPPPRFVVEEPDNASYDPTKLFRIATA